MKVIHFKHSGVLVETENYQLFFDIISDVDAYVDENKTVIFFVSHSHGDHFSERYIVKSGSNRTFVVSDDVNTKLLNPVVVMNPNTIKTIGEVNVRTFESSDLGVAFTVDIEGINIFFAGDLNWWHWGNATREAQADEEKLYKDILKTIDPRTFDIAFVPVDPRLNEAYALAGNYFLSQFNVKHFVPIHFGNQFGITQAFKEQSDADAFIHVICRENETIEW